VVLGGFGWPWLVPCFSNYDGRGKASSYPFQMQILFTLITQNLFVLNVNEHFWLKYVLLNFLYANFLKSLACY